MRRAQYGRVGAGAQVGVRAWTWGVLRGAWAMAVAARPGLYFVKHTRGAQRGGDGVAWPPQGITMPFRPVLVVTRFSPIHRA